MKVLVTGGTGFIGSKLVTALGQAGHLPVLLTRPKSSTPSTAASFVWDSTKGPPPAQAWAGVEAVINLAGESARGRWTRAKKERLLESRVGLTNELVAGMSQLDKPPMQMISMSTIGYYGDRGDETLTEDATAGHDFVSALNRQWEAAAMSAEQAGVAVARTRTGIVLGRDGGALPPLRLLGKFGLLGPVGGGRQWWSWIHVDDVVAFMLHALDQRLHGPFNLVAPDARRQRDWASTMARVMHRPGFFPAPSFGVRAVVGGFSVELLASRHVIPTATQGSGFGFAFPDLEPALEDLLAEQ